MGVSRKFVYWGMNEPIEMNNELAELMSKRQFQAWIKNNPTGVDFFAPIHAGGKNYLVHWKKDINIQISRWHTTFEEVD